MIIRFTIPGAAIPKGRARTYAETTKEGYVAFIDGKPVMKTKTPSKTRDWEHFISLIARQAAVRHGVRQPMPAGTPVVLGCLFYLPIPASWSKAKRQQARSGELRHTSRPDLSNLIKSIEDGAEGVLWENDSQIDCYGTVDGIMTKKLYGDEPRTEVEIHTG